MAGSGGGARWEHLWVFSTRLAGKNCGERVRMRWGAPLGFLIKDGGDWGGGKGREGGRTHLRSHNGDGGAGEGEAVEMRGLAAVFSTGLLRGLGYSSWWGAERMREGPLRFSLGGGGRLANGGGDSGRFQLQRGT